MVWSGHPDSQRQFFESPSWNTPIATATNTELGSRTAVPSRDASDPGKRESCQGIPLPPSPRKLFNITLSTIVLSCLLLAVTAGLIATGCILGRRIAKLEDKISTLTDTSGIDNSSSSSSSPSSSSSSTAATTTTTTLATPAPPTILVSGWKYLGCYYDSTVRLLPDASESAANMTNGACADFCHGTSRQPRHFGTQVSVQCYCGTASAEMLASRRAPDWQCGHQCGGRDDMAEICGGNWALTLWERSEE